MAVTVRIPVPLQKMTKDQAVVSVEATTIKEMVDRLEATYPGIASSIVDDNGKIRRFVNVFINEENVRSLSGESTAVKDGDEISIIPAIAGGRA